MFSLCIPTKSRFDTFLNVNLERYLENKLLAEIIICDECDSDDYNKIQATYGKYCKNGKIKLYKNDTNLGPFMNKRNACLKASCEWICLMDSDNYAPEEYLQTAKNYLESNECKWNDILAPSFAMPIFNYTHMQGQVLNKKTYKDICKLDEGKNMLMCFINTGNFVLNIKLIQNLDISREGHNIDQFSPYDVIYFNTLVLEQFNVNIHIIKDLYYQHVVHDGSIFTNHSHNYKQFESMINKRFSDYFI